ncbi:hypothetical protein Leryth_019803 [Lithospermum erythrorhizon]|nr:hypothetical protein Leryth_019803 [Lithospermum erythrorhizon]
MDITNTLYSLILILLLPFFVYLIINYFWVPSRGGENLPPGPWRWPIVGNIPHVLMSVIINIPPPQTVANLSKIYGPLLSLKLGSRLVILASSPEAAHAILNTHDRHLSGRYIAKATPIEAGELQRFSLLWSTERNSHSWKAIRDQWNDLFSSKAMDDYVKMREAKVAEMLHFLKRERLGQMVNIRDVVFTMVYNTLGNICFSKNMVNLDDDGEKKSSEVKKTIWGLMESGTTPILADFFPVFEGFDVQGARRRTKGCIDRLYKVWEDIIQTRRRGESTNNDGATKHGDFLHFMLANGWSDLQIKHMLLEVFPAATGNIPTTVEWAVAELIKNEEAMKKVRQELSTVTLSEGAILELPYLNACIKETLRLHPPIGFLPHCAQETCQVMGYTIPKDSLVIVNVWGMGHDKNIWGQDAVAFKPERFLDTNVDFKGQDYGYLPFGAGRRMCPGFPFAAKQVHLIVAALVSSFEWSVAGNRNGGEFHHTQLDMKEAYSVPIRKEKPLSLVPNLLLSPSQNDCQDSYTSSKMH